MITGRVNGDLEALVQISVEDNRGNYRAFECVLDTGSDGFVAVPADIIQELGLISRGSRRTGLVNDTEAMIPVYLAVVAWRGELSEVSVLQTEQDFLVGMALLENSTLIVEVWDGGNVLIEPRQERP